MTKHQEKSQKEILQETLELYKQLRTLGIDKQFEEMEEFYQAVQQFVREKIGASGRIKLPMLQRDLYYELITHHPKPSNILLKYTGA